MEHKLSDLRDGYVALARHVVGTGDRVTARGLDTYELRGVTLRMPSFGCALPIGVNRKVNLKLAAVEALSIVGGVSRPRLLREASPRYGDVLVKDVDGSLNYGAYGPRIAGQCLDATLLLRRDPSSRQAVLQIWDPADLTHDGDKPCTGELILQIRGGALHLHSRMRSQDVWLGLAYDAFMFTQLQHSLAHALGVMSGEWIHHVASLHVYRHDEDRVRELQPVVSTAGFDHPYGVYVHPGDHASTTHPFLAYQTTAQRLLDARASRADLNLNPWYVRQLMRLGVYDTPRDDDVEVTT